MNSDLVKYVKETIIIDNPLDSLLSGFYWTVRLKDQNGRLKVLKGGSKRTPHETMMSDRDNYINIILYNVYIQHSP